MDWEQRTALLIQDLATGKLKSPHLYILEGASAVSAGVPGAAEIVSSISSIDNAEVAEQWQGRYRITKGSPSETSTCDTGDESKFLTVTESEIRASPASRCRLVSPNKDNVYQCIDEPGKSFEFFAGQLVSKEVGRDSKQYKLCP